MFTLLTMSIVQAGFGRNLRLLEEARTRYNLAECITITGGSMYIQPFAPCCVPASFKLLIRYI